MSTVWLPPSLPLPLSTTYASSRKGPDRLNTHDATVMLAVRKDPLGTTYQESISSGSVSRLIDRNCIWHQQPHLRNMHMILPCNPALRHWQGQGQGQGQGSPAPPGRRCRLHR
eukprot:s1350_g18.t1